MTEKWTDENGEKQEKQLGANYTYSQSTPPITGIIRGRTTPSSYTKSIPLAMNCGCRSRITTATRPNR